MRGAPRRPLPPRFLEVFEVDEDQFQLVEAALSDIAGELKAQNKLLSRLVEAVERIEAHGLPGGGR